MKHFIFVSSLAVMGLVAGCAGESESNDSAPSGATVPGPNAEASLQSCSRPEFREALRAASALDGIWFQDGESELTGTPSDTGPHGLALIPQNLECGKLEGKPFVLVDVISFRDQQPTYGRVSVMPNPVEENRFLLGVLNGAGGSTPFSFGTDASGSPLSRVNYQLRCYDGDLNGDGFLDPSYYGCSLHVSNDADPNSKEAYYVPMNRVPCDSGPGGADKVGAASVPGVIGTLPEGYDLGCAPLSTLASEPVPSNPPVSRELPHAPQVRVEQVGDLLHDSLLGFSRFLRKGDGCKTLAAAKQTPNYTPVVCMSTSQ